MVAIGLVILRLGLGLVMAAHGAQKVFGWFQGPGLEGFAARLEQLAIRPGWAWALVSGVVELGGGLLIVIGLLTPIAALLLAGDLLVAILVMHLPRGFWNDNGGYELPLSLMAALVALSLIGPGSASLDQVLHLAVPAPVWLAAVIVVLIGVLAAVTSPRLQSPTTPRQPAP